MYDQIRVSFIDIMIADQIFHYVYLLLADFAELLAGFVEIHRFFRERIK